MKKKVFRPKSDMIGAGIIVLFICVYFLTTYLLGTEVGLEDKGLIRIFNSAAGKIINLCLTLLSIVISLIVICLHKIELNEEGIYVPNHKNLLRRRRVQHKVQIKYEDIEKTDFIISENNSEGEEIEYRDPRDQLYDYRYLQIVDIRKKEQRILLSGFTKKQKIKILEELERRLIAIGNPVDFSKTKERIKDYSAIYGFKSEYNENKRKSKELKEQERLEKQQKEESGAIKTVMRPKGAVAVAFKIALPCIALGCFVVPFIPLGLKLGATIAVKVVVGLIGVGLAVWWGFSWKDKIAFGEKILYAPSLQGGTHKIKYANVQKVVYRMSGTGEDEIQTEDSFYIDVKTKSYEVCVTDYSEKQKVQFLSLLQKRMRACGNDLDLTSAWDSLGASDL